MDWRDLEALIKEERRAGNPVAQYIHSLQVRGHLWTALRLCVCYVHDGAVHHRGKAARFSSEEDLCATCLDAPARPKASKRLTNQVSRSAQVGEGCAGHFDTAASCARLGRGRAGTTACFSSAVYLLRTVRAQSNLGTCASRAQLDANRATLLLSNHLYTEEEGDEAANARQATKVRVWTPCRGVWGGKGGTGGQRGHNPPARQGECLARSSGVVQPLPPPHLCSTAFPRGATPAKP